MTSRQILKYKKQSLTKFKKLLKKLEDLYNIVYMPCGYCAIERDRMNSKMGKFCSGCELFQKGLCSNKENNSKAYWKSLSQIDDIQENFRLIKNCIEEDIRGENDE